MVNWMAIGLATGLALVGLGCGEGGPKLGKGHQGWQQPECWSCHDAQDTHNADKAPYQCSKCHGDNGAPKGHDGDPPCASCHDTPHGLDGFPDPESCQTCH